jgi:hypothetical protein
METNNYVGWGFSIIVPQNILVVKKTPVEDFDLYYFSRRNGDGKPVLYAYAGNHPDFGDKAPKEHTIKKGKVAKSEAELIKWINDEGFYGCEVLINRSEKISPTYIHFWYKNLSSKDKLLADNIIESFRIK